MGESVGVTTRLLLAHTVVNIASNRTKLPDSPIVGHGISRTLRPLSRGECALMLRAPSHDPLGSRLRIGSLG
jgi:hypothetical protein